MAANALSTISKLAVAIAVVMAGASAGQAAEPQADSAKKDKSKRVCRSIVKAGTRLPTRLCMSQEEWDLAERRTQDSVLAHQKSNTQTSPLGPFEGNPR
jgi:hypothetical protein